MWKGSFFYMGCLDSKTAAALPLDAAAAVELYIYYFKEEKSCMKTKAIEGNFIIYYGNGFYL